MFGGTSVKILRNQRNISTNTLAKEIGVSRSYISLVEIGYRIPTQTRLTNFFGGDAEAPQLKKGRS